MSFGVSDEGVVIFSVKYKGQLIVYFESAILKALRLFVQTTDTPVDDIASAGLDSSFPAISKALPNPDFNAHVTEKAE